MIFVFKMETQGFVLFIVIKTENCTLIVSVILLLYTFVAYNLL